MSYLASIAYTAGLSGLNFEPFSLVPDVDENTKINFRILKSLKDLGKISISMCPIVGRHNIEKIIDYSPKSIQLIQIRHIEDAKTVINALENGKYNSDYTVNLVLNSIPSFELPQNEAINTIMDQITMIKNILN
jgi:hypothetical protein